MRPPPTAVSRSVPLWGLFLASSWTWCIGMFLPVPLLRDYGWAGFLLFAIPNVLGCSLFGWVAGERSRAWILERFRWLPSWFSVVTIAYHLFFAGFAMRTLLGPEDNAAPGTALLLVAGLALLAWGLSRAPNRAWPWLGAGAWILSLACWLALGVGGLRLWGWTGEAPTVNLAWLALVIVPGFLFSPYCDLTFYRARAAAGPAAFGVFGATFAAMLLFTASYAGDAARGVPAVVVLHLIVQGVFSSAAHARELRVLAEEESPAWPPGRSRVLAAALCVGAAIVGIAEPSESMYLRFLAFYGVVVPLLIVVGAASPTRGLPRDVNRGSLALMAAVGLSLVACEFGFLRGRPELLAAPILAGLAAIWASSSSARTT